MNGLGSGDIDGYMRDLESMLTDLACRGNITAASLGKSIQMPIDEPISIFDEMIHFYSATTTINQMGEIVDKWRELTAKRFGCLK